MKGCSGNKHQRIIGLISVLLFLSLVLPGCADLKSIRAFSEISAESTTYTTFTDDYVKSVERQKRYQDESQAGKLDEIRKEREAQRPALLAMHKSVSTYMSALGELASDEIISYDKSLDDMSDKIGTIKDKHGNQVFKKEQIDALGALSKLLSKAATDAYRQNKLKEIIASSNKDFQIVITTLKQYIEIGYIGSLDNEKVAVEKYYNTVIATAKHNPPQQAAVELVLDKFIERKDAIDTKNKAAESYIKILNKISEGHQLLYDRRADISSEQLLATIKGYGKDNNKGDDNKGDVGSKTT
jgi:hypothetical protein